MPRTLDITGEYPADWKQISDATWAAAGHLSDLLQSAVVNVGARLSLTALVFVAGMAQPATASRVLQRSMNNPPSRLKTDIIEARKVLGREPQKPVGLLLGKRLHAQLVHRGVRFPCPVAVDPMIHPEHEQWFYLEASFQPFSHLIHP